MLDCIYAFFHAVVAIANQKGGVGKTAVTLGLASAASAAGIPTLVVDMDRRGTPRRSRRHRHRVHSQRRALRRPARHRCRSDRRDLMAECVSDPRRSLTGAA
ncbi:AAA family ATPase [Rhodococcus hoagii]|nr:AAA family ATPase [Prescottella equi]